MAMIWEQMTAAFDDGIDPRSILHFIALYGLETPTFESIIGDPDARDPKGKFIEDFSEMVLSAMEKVLLDKKSTEIGRLEVALIVVSAAMRGSKRASHENNPQAT